MKAYIVYCHPDPGSFTAAVRDRAVSALEATGHLVRVADLYGDGFDPAMSRQERLQHKAPPAPPPDIARYCENLLWCDTLVFIYPTWWSGQPAMLTGWFDRVLRRGVAWELPEGASRIEARLTNVRRVVAITSHGSPKLLNVLEGESGRRVIGRGVRVLCNRLARTTWLAMYNIDHATQADREAFLDRVNRKLRGLSPVPSAGAGAETS
ncbi:MAG TPA: NAD(P)H-dependent oxidoreductase [Ilumatobacteraceae bacterium]